MEGVPVSMGVLPKTYLPTESDCPTAWITIVCVTLSGIPFQKNGIPRRLGVIAQLVERLNGIEEVWGSNPHGSTKRLLNKCFCEIRWG